jgi:hypothetical protein
MHAVDTLHLECTWFEAKFRAGNLAAALSDAASRDFYQRGWRGACITGAVLF